MQSLSRHTFVNILLMGKIDIFRNGSVTIRKTGFVRTVKTVFQDFPGLAKTKFQGFPGLTKLILNEFPG